MHQIARLLELPGNVGPSCPSPPSLNLHSLRKEAAAQSEFEICLGRPRSPIESAIRVHVFSPTLGRSSAQSPSTSPSLSPPPCSLPPLVSPSPRFGGLKVTITDHNAISSRQTASSIRTRTASRRHLFMYHIWLGRPRHVG